MLTAFSANLEAALLTLATSLVYVLIYTPLKKVTPLCTAIGAIPGAMPILLGWVAIRGQVELAGGTVIRDSFLLAISPLPRHLSFICGGLSPWRDPHAARG